MSPSNREQFRGALVALVSPMKADGSLDREAFEHLVDWHLEAGTDGLVIAGTTGESPTLEQPEFEWMVETALSRAERRIPVLVGTGTAATSKAVGQSRRAAELGADGVLVVTPYYNRPPQRGLEAHYRTIADAVTVPVVLYNVPGRTGVDLAPETALKLNEHTNIVAVKEAVADMDRVRQLVGGGMTVLSGDDSSAVDAMLNGASGVISVAANVLPARFARLCELALAGNRKQAVALDEQFKPLYEFLGVESNPIPAKWLLARMGKIKTGVRLPLVELGDAWHATGDGLIRQLDLK